jgi:hypothetical protein
VRKFLQTIGGSVYSPEFYRGLFERPFSFSFRYFVLLCLLASLASAIWVSADAVPSFRTFGDNLGPSLVNSYPDDLVITISNGKVTSNETGPVFINPLDFSSNPDIKKSMGATNLLVVDTVSPFTLGRFKDYNAVVWLTGEGMVTRDSEGKIQVIGLENVADTRIDKQYVREMSQKIPPFVTVVSFVLPILIYFAMLIYYVSTLGYLILGALIVLAIARLKKIEIGYKKSYQISLHAITLPILLSVLSFGSDFMFFSSILLAVTAWLNLHKTA